MTFLKQCSYCKEEFTTEVKIKKYCSTLCRSRVGQKRTGREAKEIKCTMCGIPFKRKGALDNKCISCKMILKEESGSIRNTQLVVRPLLEKEEEMIENFKLSRKDD